MMRMARLFIAMVPLLLSACGTVPLQDEIMYGNKGMLGAVEFHTFTPAKRPLTFEQWMQLLKTKPLICTSVQTFGDIKKFMEQVCSVCNCCAADTKERAEEFFNNVQDSQKK